MSHSIRVSGNVFDGLVYGCLEEEDSNEGALVLIVVYSIRASGRLEDDVYGGLGGGVSGNVFAGLVYGCLEDENCERRGIGVDCSIFDSC